MNGPAEQKILPQLVEEKFLLLFDGHCNLCNGAVQFVLKRDKKNQFLFAALTWPVGERLKQHFPELTGVDSIVFFDGEKVLVESSAALAVAARLGALWPLLGVFWVVPRTIRDAVYKWVARNRYRWFGKNDACMLPSPELKSKFLNDPAAAEVNK